MKSAECQAREVVAWIRSGNNIPTQTHRLLSQHNPKLLKDLQELDKIVNPPKEA